MDRDQVLVAEVLICALYDWYQLESSRAEPTRAEVTAMAEKIATMIGIPER